MCPKVTSLNEFTDKPDEENDVLYLVDTSESNPNLKGKRIKTKNLLKGRSETTSTLIPELLSTDGMLENKIDAAGDSMATYNGNQYIGFYNSSGQIVLQKKDITTRQILESQTLTAKTLTNFDDDHDFISLGFDDTGIIHIGYGIHANPLQYFKMPTSESVLGTPGSNISFIGTNETQVSYITFFNDTSNKLFVKHRDGTSGAGDTYFYSYDSGTLLWSATTGTGAAGLLFNGKGDSPDVNGYIGRPYIDSSNVAHFAGIISETGATAFNRHPFYFGINLTSFAYTKADGTTQTVPITEANSDDIDSSVVNGYNSPAILNIRNCYKDSGGSIHAMYAHNNGTSINDLFHYSNDTIGGGWVKQQLTYRVENTTLQGTFTPLLVDPTTEYFYAFFWYPNESYSWQVKESRDLGVTWSDAYTIGTPQLERFQFNVDWTGWDATGIMYRLYQNQIDFNNGDLGTGIQLVGKQRNVYLDIWNPLQGKTRNPPITNIQADEDIYIRSHQGRIVLQSNDYTQLKETKIISPSINDTNNLTIERHTTDTGSGTNIFLNNSRGTQRAPLAVADDDRLSYFPTAGHDGTSFVTAATTKIEVDNTVSTGIVPGRIVWMTRGTNGSLSDRMILSSQGNLSLNNTGDASSIINAFSVSRGVVWPRMDTTERDAISTPIEGLMIYNTDTSQYEFYDGSAWAAIGTETSGTPLDNQIAVWTGDGIIEGTTGLTFDSAAALLQTEGDFNLIAKTTSDSNVLTMERHNTVADTGNNLLFRRSKGTFSTPLTLASGDRIAFIAGYGYDGTSFGGSSANIQILATENFTASAHGGSILFKTVPNGTTSSVDRLKIDHDGTVSLASTVGAFIPNKLTTTQRDALTGVTGMTIYNTTTNKLNVCTSTGPDVWEAVTSA